MSLPFYKIVVLGQGRVGKTSISLKFVEDSFDEDQQSTINASYLQKQVTVSSGKNVILAIWDTAGQEKYNAIAPVYYRDALGAIIVYDITSAQSFQKVKKWTSELKEHADKNVVIYVAGNKCDMENLRKIPMSTVEKYSATHGVKHFNVSAKTGQGINQLFSQICEQVSSIKGGNQQVRLGSKKKKNIKIEADKPEEKPQQKKCC